MMSFLLHLAGVTVPGLWLGRALRLSPAQQIGVVFLLFETSIILGAGVLSAAGALGWLHTYQITTTLIAIGLAAGIWLVGNSPSAAGAPTRLNGNAPFANAIRTGLDAATLGAAGGALVLIALASLFLDWAEASRYRPALQLASLLIVASAMVYLLVIVSGESFRTRLSYAVPAGCLIAAAALVLWLVGSGILTWPSASILRRGAQVIVLGVAAAIAACVLRLAWGAAGSLQQIPPGTSTPMAKLAGAAWSYLPIAAVGACGTLMLWITLNAVPAVEDSVTLKLPKIVFAIIQNTMLPTTLTDDGRFYISPVYPALIQMFLVINDRTSHALLVFGFVNWAVCGAAVYELCRLLGVSRWAAWTTVALVLLTPILIVQGTSEGDDILAATPFLVALAFGFSWFKTNRHSDAIFAGLGAGLALAIKLFPVLFAPIVPLIILLALFTQPVPQTLKWIRERSAGLLMAGAAFIVALAPHAIGNWIAYGNPFYVSAAVNATRNSPFSFECVARNIVGYGKQFLFSDLAQLISLILAGPSGQSDVYRANIAASNRLFSQALPYDPSPACSAWGNEFALSNWIINDNTLWFGIFGPLLLICTSYVAFAPRQTRLARGLALGFLIWIVMFAVTQKYIAGIGRYWSMAVLVGAPAVGLAIDALFQQRLPRRARSWSAAAVVTVSTLLLAHEVLIFNTYRSVRGNLTTGVQTSFRYVDGFTEDLRAILRKANSLNVQVMYGLNNWDFYMLLRHGAEFLNKNAILDHSLNLAVARPFGLMDNPFGDPRIPVKVAQPFRGGFRYVGGVLSGLGFVNNTELTSGAEVDPGSAFLLFQLSARKEGSFIVGTATQIASSSVMGSVSFRFGWRAASGARALDPDWRRGASAEFKIPADAVAIVLQATTGDASRAGIAEWPIAGLAPDKFDRLVEDQGRRDPAPVSR